MMLPGLEDIQGFTVAGVLTRVPSDGSAFGEVWKNYMTHDAKVSPLSTDGCHYGASFATGDPTQIDYLAGVAVPAGTAAPEGLVTREIPTALYAQFDCFFKDKDATMKAALYEWLPESPYSPASDLSVLDYLRFPPGVTKADTMVSFLFPILE